MGAGWVRIAIGWHGDVMRTTAHMDFCSAGWFFGVAGGFDCHSLPPISRHLIEAQIALTPAARLLHLEIDEPGFALVAHRIDGPQLYLITARGKRSHR